MRLRTPPFDNGLKQSDPDYVSYLDEWVEDRFDDLVEVFLEENPEYDLSDIPEGREFIEFTQDAYQVYMFEMEEQYYDI